MPIVSSSGHPQGSQDQLDSECCAQASRDAWSDISWPQFAWSWQGSPLLTNQRRLSSRCLDPPQYIATAPQAINIYYIDSVTFYLITSLSDGKPVDFNKIWPQELFYYLISCIESSVFELQCKYWQDIVLVSFW